MASGIFAILDDIALLLDDAAAISKVAAKKTAGILGDDLAVNAEKATGFHASRELPVIWAITKGSFLNKIIIIPIALLMSHYTPWLIVPILLIGGAYLSFEGAEKIYEWMHHLKNKKSAKIEAIEIKKFSEKEKISSAIRTDFILSIEIIILALETVMNQQLLMQVMVVGFISLLATIGVYGLVAFIVKLDDIGLFLIEKANDMKGTLAKITSKAGELLAASLPKIIRGLEVIGTIAMLLVGGGMYVHNIKPIHDGLHFMPEILSNFTAGLLVGSFVMLLLKLKPKKS